jgi:transcriptional regulator GlxA family with amidase domain
MENLDQPLTPADIAAAAGTTKRTPNRRFQGELGMPPLNWLTAQRARHAQQLLETTDLGIEPIAPRSGMGTATNLRTHFTRQAGTTPSAYRSMFRAESTAGIAL